MAQNLSIHAQEVSLLITIFLGVLIVESASSSEVGFSVNLIHRESPLSPFYNPMETNSDRCRSVIHRSVSRVNRFAFTNNLINSIQSPVIPDSGDYLMKLSIGSPPIDILAIVDTGSDLTWIQCKPCEDCFDQSSPLFDPEQSSTFRDVACGSNSCNQLLGNGRCDANNINCEYTYYYGDLSHSSGLLAVDKFTD
ncbi:hypothetical protein C5167_047054 [Papaver somniferum]|uniref:Peptidase A1 domain-containing protein n=1 Tax=Papaver somniferum TaxID=3469 RepID=A0A4Y7LHZ6_PAPSO|nr:hypothetical protein C5167_047054 [Papaver somniferum]